MEKEIFVSAAGCDENGTGTIHSAFATVKRALKSARGRREERVRICLREGIYDLDSPIVLEEEDSGVILQSYGKERAVLLENTEGIVIAQSAFEKLGGNGVFLYGYNEGTRITDRSIPGEGTASGPCRSIMRPKSGNYTVTNETILKKTGFQNFPMDQFGKTGCAKASPVYPYGEWSGSEERKNGLPDKQ